MKRTPPARRAPNRTVVATTVMEGIVLGSFDLLYVMCINMSVDRFSSLFVVTSTAAKKNHRPLEVLAHTDAVVVQTFKSPPSCEYKMEYMATIENAAPPIPEMNRANDQGLADRSRHIYLRML